MSRLLLDTSAYAAFFRDHPGVKGEVQKASELFLSPVVLGELRSGFLEWARREENERELQGFLASPAAASP
jgi:predicted nucleic acid-binding protein